MLKQVHVAVAVIINQHQQVLIALRQAHQHQGNLWEFPGGKVEDDEHIEHALQREIEEEVGLTIHSAEQFLTIGHDYGDKSVLLDVWQVTDYSGQAYGKEGQTLRWCDIQELDDSDFPIANVEIIEALKFKSK